MLFDDQSSAFDTDSELKKAKIFAVKIAKRLPKTELVFITFFLGYEHNANAITSKYSLKICNLSRWPYRPGLFRRLPPAALRRLTQLQTELPKLEAELDYPNQRVTVCGLIIVSRSHLQQDGQLMKFISIADRTGMVECEIFAAAYRAYGLATVRHPVVQVTGEVRPFDNGQGFTLEVRRVEKARTKTPPAAQP